jgi:hypothetical protein
LGRGRRTAPPRPPAGPPTGMHPEKWFSSKVTGFAVALIIGVGGILITLDQYWVAEGCFILAAFWSTIYFSLRPYFSAPFDRKKELYLWAAALAPLIVACLIFVYPMERSRISRILSANEGWLLPADEVTPRLCVAPGENYRVLWLGTTPVETTFFPQSIINVHRRVLLSINKRGNSIAVSANIYSPDTRAIAVLKDNHWKTNPNNYMSKYNPDFSSLIVDDQYNKRVLDVRYINECNIRIYLILRYDGAEVEFNEKGVFVDGRLRGSDIGFIMRTPDISAIEVGDDCSGAAAVCLREH